MHQRDDCVYALRVFVAHHFICFWVFLKQFSAQTGWDFPEGFSKKKKEEEKKEKVCLTVAVRCQQPQRTHTHITSHSCDADG